MLESLTASDDFIFLFMTTSFGFMIMGLAIVCIIHWKNEDEDIKRDS